MCICLVYFTLQVPGHNGAKKRYQVCYTKHTAPMMTLGYQPEALRLESFHASGTKKTNCILTLSRPEPWSASWQAGHLTIKPSYQRDHGVQLIRQCYIEDLYLCQAASWFGAAGPGQWWLTLVCARALPANTVTQSQSIREPQADPSHQRPLNHRDQCVTQTSCSAGQPGPAAES